MLANSRKSDHVLLNSGNAISPFDTFSEVPCTKDVETDKLQVADMNGDGKNEWIFGNDGVTNTLLINLGDGMSFKEPSEKDISLLPE